MDISVLGLVRSCTPNLPNIIKTTALSLVGQSHNSEHQDTLTEAIVVASRPVLQTPAPLLAAQIRCNADWGIGRPWISKYTVPEPPENGLSDIQKNQPMTMRQAVRLAIEAFNKSSIQSDSSACSVPGLTDVDTEWTFYRPKSLPIGIPSDLSEQQRYDSFMQHSDSNGPTILHFHGGAFCLMDPSTHRWIVSDLAKHSHGRVLSVRYRLSPQTIFPGALLDALQAFLALLAPPPGSFHKPVPANKIVISGDSSGGNLASSLLLLLLNLAKNNVTISFHNTSITIPSPPCAGLSVVSPWLDLTRSLPSTTKNTRWDIIAPPPLDAASPPFPPDEIWPTSPPRAETYCTANMVTHPLVSPVAARPSDWIGTPPIHVTCGWEGFTDEIEVFARRIYQSSPTATVHFDGWMGMPHCFSVMPWNRAGRTAMANWGRFCELACQQPDHLHRTETGTWSSSVKPSDIRHIKLDELGMRSDGTCGYERTTALDDRTVDEMMERGRRWRVGLEEEMVRKWKEEQESGGAKSTPL